MSAAPCHHYDAIRSRDVISHVTIRHSIDYFLYFLNRNKTRISLSFHDVITPGSTVRVDRHTKHNIGDHCVKRLSRENSRSRPRRNILMVMTTSSSHVSSSVMWPSFDIFKAGSYRLPIGINPLSTLVTVPRYLPQRCGHSHMHK